MLGQLLSVAAALVVAPALVEARPATDVPYCMLLKTSAEYVFGDMLFINDFEQVASPHGRKFYVLELKQPNPQRYLRDLDYVLEVELPDFNRPGKCQRAVAPCKAYFREATTATVPAAMLKNAYAGRPGTMWTIPEKIGSAKQITKVLSNTMGKLSVSMRKLSERFAAATAHKASGTASASASASAGGAVTFAGVGVSNATHNNKSVASKGKAEMPQSQFNGLRMMYGENPEIFANTCDGSESAAYVVGCVYGEPGMFSAALLLVTLVLCGLLTNARGAESVMYAKSSASSMAGTLSKVLAAATSADESDAAWAEAATEPVCTPRNASGIRYSIGVRPRSMSVTLRAPVLPDADSVRQAIRSELGALGDCEEEELLVAVQDTLSRRRAARAARMPRPASCPDNLSSFGAIGTRAPGTPRFRSRRKLVVESY